VKAPGAKGYISQSTKTTDEHAAYKFADDLFLRCLARVASGQDISSKHVSTAIKEYVNEASVLGEPSFKASALVSSEGGSVLRDHEPQG
jgi:hypothetical protein